MEDIRARIVSGEWPPGHKLPSGPQLVEHYGVSTNTVRAVIIAMTVTGELRGEQGRGVYVADQPRLDSAGNTRPPEEPR